MAEQLLQAPTTQLNPLEETLFKSWAKANGLDDVDSPDNRYDYRGFYKESNGKVHPPGVVANAAAQANKLTHPDLSKVDGPMDALRKATTIEAAPPTEMEGARNVLNGGIQGVLGAVGLGDDSSQANRFGQMVAAAPPLGVGGYIKKMLSELGTARSAETDAQAVRTALGSRVTPSMGVPRTQIRLPKGFAGPEQAPPSEANQQYDAWQKVVNPPKPVVPMLTVKSPDELQDIGKPGPVKNIPPPLTSKPVTGQANTNTGRANPEIVKDIRKIGKEQAMAKYPNMARSTVEDIINRNSWHWVKD